MTEELELKIIKQELPVVEINFDEIKKDLSERLINYKSMVVVEETLSICKSRQKELAGLRTKIDTYRKTVKTTMSKPIVAFEEKCKQLISLVEEAEMPLKEGIKVFDDQKREEKKQEVMKIIDEVVTKYLLGNKYAEQLTISDKYTNLTAKESDVRADVDQRAFTLLAQQNHDQELLLLVQDTIDTVNKTIKKQLSLDDFKYFIDHEMPTRDIIVNVNAMAARIFDAENPKPVEVKPIIEEAIPAIEPEIIIPFSDKIKVAQQEWYINVKVTAFTVQIEALERYLQENHITYFIEDKYMVEDF